MSISVIEQVERDFLSLEGDASKEQWQNPKYIWELAVKVETSNLPLAYRLLQRGHNLKPDGRVIKNKLESLAIQLKDQGSPFFQETISKEMSDSQQPSKSKIVDGSILSRINSLQPFTLFVALPCLIFFLYQSLWSSDRFESRAQVLIKQPNSASILSPEMALLSGFGISTGDNDAKLVEAFIYSVDMLSFLENKLSLKKHYSSYSVDFFNRLHNWDGREDFAVYYKNHIKVTIKSDSSIITIHSQAYSADFAHLLNQTIIERAEWFINEVGHQLANEQLAFISKEHEKWTNNLETVQKKMLAYQQKNKLLDPMSEGVALQSIAYNLEGQLASKSTELKAAEKLMSQQAPEVLRIKNQMEALSEQLKSERDRLTNDKKNDESVSRVIAKFSELKVNFELALQAYSGSLASLEKVRIEAYRQIKYLVTIEQATLPDESAYPRVFYNTLLMLLILSLLFGIIRIVIATIKELS